MLTRRSLVCLVSLLTIGWSHMRSAEMEVGKTYHGFTLNEKRFVPEVNADVLIFSHDKSGARVMKIAADDPNKTFCITFKTVPQSDDGAPHIMEHSVLNGSKHFPVKSPFDELSKGSLKTFLNAFTGNDLTAYPVASMNEKDYFNLMHVYLDAVFFPLIETDQRIFKQEGWHYELADADSPLVYKGVVYNEMKGAFSDSRRELNYEMMKNLFPDNAYRYMAGGYPSMIPHLSYEAFLAFHRRYYHPDNSYILLYGNADLDRELAFIDSEYLSKFDRSGKPVTIPIQKPFDAMKVASAFYPVPEGEDTANQTFLSLSFVAGTNDDEALVMALEVLTDVLVNQESAPVRLALQEAGIGREVRSSVDNLQQNIVDIVVQNANAGDRDRFREVVMSTLRKVAEEGLNKQAVEGTINRMEFRLREGNDAQKGLTYLFQTLPVWMHTGDPLPGLAYEAPLARVKTALESDYLESIIRTYLLENPHALLLVLEPKPGLETEQNAAIQAELAAKKASLSSEELQSLVKGTQELIAYQKREDTPEALATIPSLSLQDIGREADWYAIEERSVSGIPLLYHETFTNNVVYLSFYFDARVLPKELIPYGALLTELLGSLNTENYSFGDLDIALNINTGGFRASLDAFLEHMNDAEFLPKLSVTSRAVSSKVDKLFELVGEIVARTRYGDADRLKTVLTQHQSRLDSRIRRDGMGYAITRLESYYTNDGMFRELTGGMEYYWFVTGLVKDFETNHDEISARLNEAAALLFTRDNLFLGLTCGRGDLSAVEGAVERFVPTLKEGEAEPGAWTFDFAKKNEGLLTASKVQYVVQGYDFRKLGYEWSGKMRVLTQILSREWLQNRIRVIGGAYGGWASFSPYGRAFFASYRDPNLKETLENYAATPEYLVSFEADDAAMARYIIGTISGLDRPLTPSQRGDRAVLRYFQKTTQEEVQAERAAVLSTTAADIRAMAPVVEGILAQEAYCVYGNEQKLESAKNLFKSLVRPTR
jgi:Zn-dependent M16 (insulinase) family peptidase